MPALMLAGKATRGGSERSPLFFWSNETVTLYTDISGPSEADLERLRRQTTRQVQRALLKTVAITAERGKSRIRERMAGAGLGRLGNAIAGEADRRIHYRAEGFSASAQFYVRSGSPRTRGAIEAYTEGAEIAPRRGRWLWVPTDNAHRLVGSGNRRRRLTPGLWREYGLDKKIGPLFTLKSVNGLPLMAVKDVGVALSGSKPSAKSLRKNGQPRKGQVEKPLIVMFIGIPRTARAARVNLTAILERVRDEFPATFDQQLMMGAR